MKDLRKEAILAWLKTPAGAAAVLEKVRLAKADLLAGRPAPTIRLADVMLTELADEIALMQLERRAERRAGFSASDEAPPEWMIKAVKRAADRFWARPEYPDNALDELLSGAPSPSLEGYGEDEL